jgi:Predicted permease
MRWQNRCELNLDDRFGVAVTRVTRADLEMTAVPGLRLQFGDQLQIVGRAEDLDKAATASAIRSRN